MTLRTPGPPVTDPDSGNQLPGQDVDTPCRAYLSQRPVENLSSAIEDQAGRDTVTSLYTLLVPAGSPLTAKTIVIDADGNQYAVEGDPAPRRDPGGRGVYIAAALKRVSDLQGVQ